MKKLLNGLLIVAILLINQSQATEADLKTLLYISPSNYQHSVHLLHPYYDYWFAQGPIVEPIALAALQRNQSDLALCKTGETAQRIIKLTPNIFYNPQMRVYHSQLEANVYSGGGSLLGTYIGRAQQQGFNSVDNGLQMHLKKAYALAMEDLMHNMRLSPNATETNSEVKLPCSVIGAQVEPKINLY